MKVKEFYNKYINLLFLIIIWGILFINFFQQEYFLGFLVMIFTLIAYGFFKKWKYLIIFMTLSILSYNLINYYHINLYKIALVNFVNDKMKNSSEYVYRSKNPNPHEEYNKFNLVQERLNKLNYINSDISIEYKGNIKNYLYFLVNVKDICFSIITEGRINQGNPFFIIYVENTNVCSK